jgi:hypothetical protein
VLRRARLRFVVEVLIDVRSFVSGAVAQFG